MPENARIPVRPRYLVDFTGRTDNDDLYIEIDGDLLASVNPDDRDIARLLFGSKLEEYRAGKTAPPSTIRLRNEDIDSVLTAVCATGLAHVRRSAVEVDATPVRWDDHGPWRLDLTIDRDAEPRPFLEGRLIRDGAELSLRAPKLLHPSGILYVDDTLARLDDGGMFLVAATLRNVPRIRLSDEELAEMLEAMYSLPHAPRIALPTDLPIPEARIDPRPWLSVVNDPSPWGGSPPSLTLGFEYGGVRITADHENERVFDKTSLTLYRRDRDAERTARDRLIAAGARIEPDFSPQSETLTIGRSRLTPLISELVRDGWKVESSGVRYRAPGEAQANIRSGIDWFDLDLVMDYDGATASLSSMLEALRKRESTVTLSDGSVGLLPMDWLSRFAPVLAAGKSTEDTTRFERSQIGLLDALLAAMPEVSVDETFERAREKLHAFEGIAARDPAPSFQGTLRHYQNEGLGWLHFLREFKLGGCLADDMGLGKTIQVLALLDSIRGDSDRPSVIVVPRSLIFNWMREAARFTPELRVLDYSGVRRRAGGVDFSSYDVVLTTYGTMRSDIAELSEVDFEYAILDEAQAIKNAGTVSAKAARLLRAKHRLALSGTPVENRIEELWSLFEFLNPGMLGAASTFGLMAELSADAYAADKSAGHDVLRRALRPVILRRTKEQVAPELPERVEQNLLVDMEPAQQIFYMELLAATRRTVIAEVDRVGMGGARMHILEALLRLRQAACHPALVDSSRPNLPSAKIDALVPSLAEIVAEGHKAVVFSQFTSFLAIVRHRLEEAGMQYEYLDGSTRDREARVDRFQSAGGPPVFLVSLKAGGQGLNLTAADYVYLLDPWWNPAVEAQAIDRAHRIGQTRCVIATRMIARGTIEEKMLELQASKRALADAILGGEQGVLTGIGREELEILLAG